ncbi:sodium/glucose cotransporter 4-like [Ptychodera flava]|uniref:sodium/glucose cotransporter 4-like n=1 Tax=Ptychodera flava TaxID=63121 RepID=UPI00396A4E67
MASEIEFFDPLHAVDYVVIVALLIGVVILGLWSSRRANRSTKSGYFLAGRSMGWVMVGLSLYASQVGPANFIGIAGASAIDGVAVIAYEFTAVTCLFLLGFLFVPVYIASGAFTMPEYIQKRFGGQRLQIYLAVTQLFLNIFVHVTGELFSGVLIIQLAMGWNIYAACIALFILTAIITIAGGLTAVMHTDAMQAIIIMSGAIVLMILSWVKIGSYSAFETQFMEAIPHTTLANNTTCGVPTDEVWHIFRPVDSSMPWPGILIGVHILSLYYWCSNQVIVQRCLAAKNISHATAGTTVAGWLKMMAMFIMVWPGMISRILYTDTVACVHKDVCSDRCGNSAGCSNMAYPYLILDLLPIGLRGLILAAMLAGVMSSLTSIFNSASTVFTLDIWKKIRPKASNREEMVVGRLWTLIMVVASVLWLPVMETYGQGVLFNYLQAVSAHITPPFIACFILAISWERINEPGAFIGAVFGTLFGLGRMVLSFVYVEPGCDEPDTRIPFLRDVHFLHFAIILLVSSILVTIGISLVTKPQPKEQLVRLTWWTRHSKEPRVDPNDQRDDEPGVDKGHVNTEMKLEVDEETVKDNDGSQKGGQEKTDVNEVEIKDESEADTGNQKESIWMCMYHYMCGYSHVSEKTIQEEAERDKAMTSLDEDPKWASFAVVNSVIMLLACVFMWGYFG